jgi:3-deoxy-D-manno-octulosonic-acid transferase
MRYLADFLYILALLVISPKIIYRVARHGRYRNGWNQRLGKVGRLTPEKKCIWIHAVSVGEVNAAKGIIQKLTESLTDYEVVLSSTTDTGYARAKAIYGQSISVFYFPFDFSPIMQRAFDRLKPDACLLMELEVWPNMSAIAKERSIPVVVVNGRLSEKSFPRYKLIKPITSWMFGMVDLFLVQSEEYAERFKALGCDDDKVIISGSVKYDTAEVADKVAGTDQLAAEINIGSDPLWVAGATGPAEEKIILDVFKKLKQQDNFADLRLAVVPRKPERFNEVDELIKACRFDHCRYSHIKAKGQNDEKPTVILGDTMGDLRKFYSLASVVFVGRTLVPMGGSDMMEPAALGKPTIFGTHTFNFKQTVNVLLKGNGAVEVKDENELLSAVTKCLTDKDYANNLSNNGQNVIRENQGATEKTITAIKKLLSI